MHHVATPFVRLGGCLVVCTSKALDMVMSVPSVLVDTAARLTCRVKPVPTTSLWPGPVKSKALLLMQNGFRVSGMTPI